MDTKKQEFQERIKEFEKTQDIPIYDPHEYLVEMREIFKLMSEILEHKIAKFESENEILS